MPDWKLRVWAPDTAYDDQTDANAQAVYTPASPGGILDGFTWSRAPSGDCKELRFWGSPSSRGGSQRLDIGPRDIVHLLVDEDDSGTFTDAFRGVVIQCLQPNDPRKGQYVAVGMRKLIEDTLVDDRRLETTADANSYVTSLATLIPDQIDVAPIVATGSNLSGFYAPYIKLSQAFDLFAHSVPGYEWGVSSSGRFFFGQTSGSLAVTVPEADVRFLPVAAEDVASKVVMVVLSKPYPDQADVSVSWLSGMPEGVYLPETVVHSYEDSAHATYGAERAFLIQPGAFPFTRGSFDSPAGTLFADVNMSNSANASDDDEDTFASNTADGFFRLSLLGGVLFYGAEVVYELTDGTAALSVVQDSDGPIVDGGYHNTLALDLPITDGVSREVVLFPMNLKNVSEETYVMVSGDADAAGDIKVYELRPLVLDTDMLDNIAKRLIRLPATEPSQITLYRYESPVPTVTVTGARGSPDGDAKEWRYELTTKGLKTTVDLGVRDESEDARVIRLTAQDISDRSQDNLRLFKG